MSALSGHFLNPLDGFETVGTVLKLFGQFDNCPDGLKKGQTVLKLSERFQYCPDGFNTIRTVSILFRQQIHGSAFHFAFQVLNSFKGKCWALHMFFVSHCPYHHRDDNALLYVARDIYALFISHGRGLRAFLTCCGKWIRLLRPEKNCP